MMTKLSEEQIDLLYEAVEALVDKALNETPVDVVSERVVASRKLLRLLEDAEGIEIELKGTHEEQVAATHVDPER